MIAMSVTDLSQSPDLRRLWRLQIVCSSDLAARPEHVGSRSMLGEAAKLPPPLIPDGRIRKSRPDVLTVCIIQAHQWFHITL